MVILNLLGITFHPVVVLGPEHDFLFKSTSTCCLIDILLSRLVSASLKSLMYIFFCTSENVSRHCNWCRSHPWFSHSCQWHFQSGGFMLIGIITVGILMISIKIVCRLFQNSIMNERNEFQTSANLDSIVLNLDILLIFVTNSILFTTYWKG